LDLLDQLTFGLTEKNFQTKKLSFRQGKSVDPRLVQHLVLCVGRGGDAKVSKWLSQVLEPWHFEKQKTKSIQRIVWDDGVITVLRTSLAESEEDSNPHSVLRPSVEAKCRDLVGGFLRNEDNLTEENIIFGFLGCDEHETAGALLGVGVAAYKYKDATRGSDSKFVNWKILNVLGFEKIKTLKSDGRPLRSVAAILATVRLPAVSSQVVKASLSKIRSVNLARHLANMPAADLGTVAYSNLILRMFNHRKNVQVEVLNDETLLKKGFGLLHAVGAGSVDGSRLVHIRYRPKGSLKKAPVAYVGKGVVFDTGGLDIKPSSGMRLMKKDMAGSAVILGLADFVTTSNGKIPCDFYLPIAENSVSAKSMRPGDVFVARNGMQVEIDNTDAEGRLILADAIVYALEDSAKRLENDERGFVCAKTKGISLKSAKDIQSKLPAPSVAPRALIDAATLTGAMRVAVGASIAGYMCNNSRLKREFEDSAQLAGEPVWQLPIVKKYFKQLRSPFADFKNSSDGGMGGAIVAGMFLEKFVGQVPWLHLDFMGWNSGAEGAYCEGANAQGLCGLMAHYVSMK
jgi:leucyl aminopeptidase